MSAPSRAPQRQTKLTGTILSMFSIIMSAKKETRVLNVTFLDKEVEVGDGGRCKNDSCLRV